MNLSVDPFSHFSPPHRIKEVTTPLMTEAVNKSGVGVGAGESLTECGQLVQRALGSSVPLAPPSARVSRDFSLSAQAGAIVRSISCLIALCRKLLLLWELCA